MWELISLLSSIVERRSQRCNGRLRSHSRRFPRYFRRESRLFLVLPGAPGSLLSSSSEGQMLNDKAGFEQAVKETITHVNFDVDSRVQVFEVTIRMMGGLVRTSLPLRFIALLGSYAYVVRLPVALWSSPRSRSSYNNTHKFLFPSSFNLVLLFYQRVLPTLVQRRVTRPSTRFRKEVVTCFRESNRDSIREGSFAERVERERWERREWRDL